MLVSVRKQGLGVTEVQERGNQLVREFVRGEKVQGLISQLGIQASQLNLKRCFRTILNQVAGKEDVDQKGSAERLVQLREAAASQPPPAASTEVSAPRRVSGGRGPSACRPGRNAD